MSDLTEAQRDSLNECECGDFLNEHSPEGCLGTDYANDDDLCMCLRSPDEIRANAIVAMLAAERDALLAKFEALAEDLAARKANAWSRYMSARGVGSQAVWQGRFDSLTEAHTSLVEIIKEARA